MARARDLCLAFLAALVLRTTHATAEVVLYRPIDDREIIQTLHQSGTVAVPRELRSLDAKAKAHQNDPAVIASIAKIFATESKRVRDPRLMGRAQSMLKPWWDEAHPPTEILFLKAFIKQHNHDFSGAKKDVETLLQADPDHIPARLMLVTLLQISGDYGQSREECKKLPRDIIPLIKDTCTLWQESLMGKAQTSYAELTAKVKASRKQSDGYAVSALADMARRLGLTSEAEILWTQSLASSPEDTTLMTSLADIYIDQKRYADVLKVIGERLDMDTILIRLAIAAKELHHPRAKEYYDLASDAIALNTRRGLTSHLREEALYRLYLEYDPKLALESATKNWQNQREPFDLHLLISAAVAAKSATTIAIARQWISERHFEDVRIQNDLEGTVTTTAKHP